MKDVVALGAASAREVIGAAAAIESRSEHPIGRAILRHAGREGVDVSSRRIDLRRYGWPDAPGDLDRWLWRVGDEN